jgi:hypothetical protein
VEGHREDVVGVPAKHPARAAVDRPHADGAVQTAGGDPTAIGAEGGRVDVPLVAAEPGGRLVRLRIQEDEDVLLGIHDGQPAAVGAVSPHRPRRREQALSRLVVADVQAVNLVRCDVRRGGQPASVGTDGYRT